MVLLNSINSLDSSLSRTFSFAIICWRSCGAFGLLTERATFLAHTASKGACMLYIAPVTILVLSTSHLGKPMACLPLVIMWISILCLINFECQICIFTCVWRWRWSWTMDWTFWWRGMAMIWVKEGVLGKT